LEISCAGRNSKTELEQLVLRIVGAALLVSYKNEICTPLMVDKRAEQWTARLCRPFTSGHWWITEIHSLAYRCGRAAGVTKLLLLSSQFFSPATVTVFLWWMLSRAQSVDNIENVSSDRIFLTLFDEYFLKISYRYKAVIGTRLTLTVNYQ